MNLVQELGPLALINVKEMHLMIMVIVLTMVMLMKVILVVRKVMMFFL